MNDEFWAKAYMCLTCGKPHEYRLTSGFDSLPRTYSWADPEDGHVYRTVIPIGLIDKLRAHMESQ